jgi:CheY-like chemotaxis protein
LQSSDRSAFLNNTKILLAGDSKTSHEVFLNFAKAWNFRLKVVRDATEATKELIQAYAAKDPFHLGIAAFRVPEIDGTEFVRTLASNPTLAKFPLVLLTSVQNRIDLSQSTFANVAATVTKPVREDAFLRACSKTLQGTPELAKARGLEVASDEVASADELRILVVEDNPVNQRVVQLQLKKAGFKTTLAGNGLEAIQALQKSEFDLIFMDCQMPILDGYEATRRIKGSDRFGHIHVVAMTANSMDGDREKCLAAGMDDYLSKPTKEADLKAAIDRAIVASRSRKSDSSAGEMESRNKTSWTRRPRAGSEVAN